LGTRTASITSIRREDELNRLSKEKAASLARAKRLSEEHDKAWKKEIIILAEIIEKEYVLLGQRWLIRTISQDISRLYMEYDIPIWDNIDRYVPAKYQQVKLAQEQSSSLSQSVEQELLEQSYTLKRVLSNLSSNISDIGRVELAQEIEAAESFVKKARKRAALEHIALGPDENASFTDQINDSKEQDRQHVTIDRPIPHGSLMFDAIGRKIKRWQNVQNRVFQFPPEILEKDQEYADALEAGDLWMDPILDLKYSKSLQDWLKAESYRDVYGKHAAGVMSYSVTNLCAFCSDEKTKEWVRMEPKYAVSYSVFVCLQCNASLKTVCPACNLPMRESIKPQIGWQCPECEGTEPIRRNLTREQIGDKSGIIMEIAEKFLERIPDAATFCSWYRGWLERRVSGRKSRLSSDLSERA
jgi:hypothetical protein